MQAEISITFSGQQRSAGEAIQHVMLARRKLDDGEQALIELGDAALALDAQCALVGPEPSVGFLNEACSNLAHHFEIALQSPILPEIDKMLFLFCQRVSVGALEEAKAVLIRAAWFIASDGRPMTDLDWTALDELAPGATCSIAQKLAIVATRARMTTKGVALF